MPGYKPGRQIFPWYSSRCAFTVTLISIAKAVVMKAILYSFPCPFHRELREF
jgi:hypothetical protein